MEEEIANSLSVDFWKGLYQKNENNIVEVWNERERATYQCKYGIKEETTMRRIKIN